MRNPPYLPLVSVGAAIIATAILSSPAVGQNPGQWSKFRAHVSTETWSRFGESCRSAGDKSGVIHLYSGASGGLIRTHYGAADNSQFGMGLAAMGDINGDGISDYAIGDDAYGSPTGMNFGSVDLYSGADGHPDLMIKTVRRYGYVLKGRVLLFSGRTARLRFGQRRSRPGDDLFGN